MLNKATTVLAVCMVFCVGSLTADCITCDSSKSPECAQNPQHLPIQKCNSQTGMTSCYTRVVSGITYRGCFSELDEGIQNSCKHDNLGQNCSYCENKGITGCNNMIFPLYRLRCHTCDENGNKGNCFTGIEQNALPCKVYQPEDQCYIRKTEKSIERGCLSDTTKCTNMLHCFICEGSGCNNLAGNNSNVPIAPNSATAWTSALATVLVATLLNLKLSS